VRRFGTEGAFGDLPLPHMGWNDVRPAPGNPLFREFGTDARFYFLHSYYMACDAAQDKAAVASYGIDFCCAVNAGNIYGVQFHPEKSHHDGTRLLRNFAEL
jgi:glutamine amidotransferase